MSENLSVVVREEAAKHFKSASEVDAFVHGFEKKAFSPEALKLISRTEVLKNIGKVGIGLAGGLVGAAILKGINSGSDAYQNNVLHSKYEAALLAVSNNNKIIKGANPTKVKSYADTIFKFAPHVASDPNLLGSLLVNSVLGEGVDTMTIKTLVELEGKYKDNTSSSSLLGIRV